VFVLTILITKLFSEGPSSHWDIPRSTELLWKTEGPVGETSLPDRTQHSQQTDIHGPGGIRTRNPSKTKAAEPHIRRRGQWDRLAKEISAVSKGFW
jgi:hypothetical protein